MGEITMVRMNAGSVLFGVKCRYVTIYYLSGLFYVKAQNRQHLPLWWMLAFLCCGVELGDGKLLLSYSSETIFLVKLCHIPYTVPRDDFRQRYIDGNQAHACHFLVV